MAKVGRPTSYSLEVATELCLRIATSSKGIRGVCHGPNMPSVATVYRWLTEYSEFREQYARAKEMQATVLFEEIVELADRPRKGFKVKTYSDGKTEKTSGDMTERSRLQVDARKWVLAKLLPKKYGDRIDVGVGAEDPLVELLNEFRAQRESSSHTCD